MLKIKTTKGEYKVEFQHDNPLCQNGWDEMDENDLVPGTYCEITNLNNDKSAGGVAALSRKDACEFRRSKGRKFALRRALDDFGMDRDERTEFYNEVMNKFNIGQWDRR